MKLGEKQKEDHSGDKMNQYHYYITLCFDDTCDKTF